MSYYKIQIVSKTNLQNIQKIAPFLIETNGTIKRLRKRKFLLHSNTISRLKG